jgi:NADP-dependent 3-hydroxy acid dehydrogenase YdfG
MGSLAKELFRWRIRVIDDCGVTAAPMDQVLRLPADSQGNVWAFRQQHWYRQELLPAALPASTAVSHREGGVYVIVGGAGGIGEIYSEYLLREYRAQLVWIGRRPLDAEIQSKIERLAALGNAPLYISADASDAAQLRAAHETIASRYGSIHGVVHSAVGVLDQSIEKVATDHFSAVLSSKLAASVCLAQVFGPHVLDFFVFFSSLNSFGKEGGKSGYSAGCTFIDAFAHRLSQQGGPAVKVMNWGYWGDVGSGERIPQSAKNRVARQGLGAITAAEGMRAVATLLAGPLLQLACLKLTDAGYEPKTESAPEGSEHIVACDEWVPSLSEMLAETMDIAVEAR